MLHAQSPGLTAHPLLAAVQAVCNESFRRCTTDNVTVVTVFLDWNVAVEKQSSEESAGHRHAEMPQGHALGRGDGVLGQALRRAVEQQQPPALREALAEAGDPGNQ
eukprot:Skav231555  [mRNA]  locus=scaffold481:39015:39482:- [translate_table: standard]